MADPFTIASIGRTIIASLPFFGSSRTTRGGFEPRDPDSLLADVLLLEPGLVLPPNFRDLTRPPAEEPKPVSPIPGDTPSVPPPVTLPPVSTARGVSPGITNLQQILQRDSDGLRLPEFDIIRSLPFPGGFPGGGRPRRRSRREETRERQARRTREQQRRQRQQRKREQERLEQLRRLGQRLPDRTPIERPEPVPAPARRPDRPGRIEFDPLPGVRTTPAPRPAPVPRTAPAGPPRPTIGRPPATPPRPSRFPATAFLGAAAGIFAASVFRPGTAPRVRTQFAPSSASPAPSPSVPTIPVPPVGLPSPQPQPRPRTQRKRDRCEKQRRGEKRRRCYRGFFKESATRTDFTRWVEIDCRTGRRLNKGKKVSQRVGKTGRVLKKVRKATSRRIPRGVIPIG